VPGFQSWFTFPERGCLIGGLVFCFRLGSAASAYSCKQGIHFHVILHQVQFVFIYPRTECSDHCKESRFSGFCLFPEDINLAAQLGRILFIDYKISSREFDPTDVNTKVLPVDQQVDLGSIFSVTSRIAPRRFLGLNT